MTIPLAQLTMGRDAKVVSVDAAQEVGQRIMEMGVVPGSPIRLVGIAPLGDPLVFEVRGYRLSLRRREAELVAVEPST
jgi:Fe2+ transport system protein FeoA